MTSTSEDRAAISAGAVKSKHDFNSITEALTQIEALRQDLERVHTGLMLMSFSVEKLMDIVTLEPTWCAGFFDFLIPRTQQSLGREGTGLYTVSHHNNNSLAGDSNGGGGGGARKNTGEGRVTNPFKNRKIRLAGYKNLGSATNNTFSIESNDDDDDL